MTTTPNTEPSLKLPHDILLPDPVTAWPLAYGWWIVIALGVFLLIGIGGWLWQRHRQQQPWRDALKQLQQLNVIDDDRAFLSACAHWLKQKAISFYGREQTAALHGDAWLMFLDNTGNTTEFSTGAGQQLKQLYQSAPSVQREALLQTMTLWLQQQMQAKRHV